MQQGDHLTHYRILGLLGSGGMGEVYRAEDTRLKRQVAIKVLTPALSEQAEAKQRLLVEAQAASALDHPNICTIYEVDETADGRVFLVMAYYEGMTLARRIASGAIPLGESIEILIQLTRALVAAHDAGVIHRDIKPANIFVTSRPVDDPTRVKLLDFGIAKLADQTGLTRTGTTVGTMAYMAPEHIGGHAIDQRADIWSIGVVLYELISGRRPFDSSNAMSIVSAIANDTPPALTSAVHDAPAAIDRIADRALRKRVEERYQTARELLADLESLKPSLIARPATVVMAPPAQARGRGSKMLAAALASVAVLGVASWMFTQRVRANEITKTVADIRTLIETEQYTSAFRRLRDLRPDVAADPAIVAAERDYFVPMRIVTDPPGADVFVKGYDEVDGAWIALGQSPINTRGPIAAALRWRIGKAGYETFEGSGPPAAGGDLNFVLSPSGTVPDGMVRVPGGGGVSLPPFYIDRYEVTNKAYKAFVDAGGYRDASFWPASFVKDGKTLSWQQATREFLDTTGRPGPATWELGTYPEGQDDYPVSGISWYEAAAYAKFKGRSLPTVYHWRAAAVQSIYSQILQVSNFGTKGTVRVGSMPSLGPFGTYDMAGNVKEWCENEVDGKRYILGGGWNEPNYQYRGPDARAPFDRSATNGVRLIATPDPAAVLATDIWVAALDGSSTARPIVNTKYHETDPVISPDGKWLAYSSDESGRSEVYVRSFPADDGKWQVSTTGGVEPRWRGDSKELFFLDRPQLGNMMSVDASVVAGAFSATAPRVLFAGLMLTFVHPGPQGWRDYDVSADGQRFLMPVNGRVLSFNDQVSPPIVVVSNWAATLKK